MFHKLGYEYVCEQCEQPKREQDMGPYDTSPVCQTCFDEMPPEDQNYARLQWEAA